jgi:hypothetical protein
MSKLGGDGQLQLPIPLGASYVEALRYAPLEEVRALADTPDAERVFDAVQFVMLNEPVGAYLHSALCAMSLPTRRPKGDKEFEPIIRRDGNYSLVIKPGERMVHGPDGHLTAVKMGVPFGIHARLILHYIMTEAVKQKSRDIYLGDSFAQWMRRMGLTSTNSGGSRSSRALLQEQVERLMACEWTLRWDQDVSHLDPKVAALANKSTRTKKGVPREPAPVSAFAVAEMRLVKGYSGTTGGAGEFVSRFVLSEAFYEALQAHMVPLNERAIAALAKTSSPTQLDLYAFLAYRLPRIKPGEEVVLRWDQLKMHLGSDIKEMPKFRQTVRRTWQTVSGVYQQARHSVDFGDLRIRLRYAEPPVENHMRKRTNGMIDIVSLRQGSADEGRPEPRVMGREVGFPRNGSIRFGHPELLQIAREHGNGTDIDLIAMRFQNLLKDEVETCTGERLLKRFEAFCKRQKASY